jgi:hypothetical protein
MPLVTKPRIERTTCRCEWHVPANQITVVAAAFAEPDFRVAVEAAAAAPAGVLLVAPSDFRVAVKAAPAVAGRAVPLVSSDFRPMVANRADEEAAEADAGLAAPATLTSRRAGAGAATFAPTAGRGRTEEGPSLFVRDPSRAVQELPYFSQISRATNRRPDRNAKRAVLAPRRNPRGERAKRVVHCTARLDRGHGVRGLVVVRTHARA